MNRIKYKRTLWLKGNDKKYKDGDNSFDKLWNK